MTTRVLRGGVGADGEPFELRVDDAGGTIVTAGPSVVPAEGEEVVDCAGQVVLAAPADPHLHLDKVDTSWRLKNPTDELADAVRVWTGGIDLLDADEVRDRAVATIDDFVANGCTALRSHVNLGPTSGDAPLKGLLAARDEVADRCDVQLVVLVKGPLRGDGDGPVAARAVIRSAVDAGVDLIGGAPHSAPDPASDVQVLFAMAAEMGVGVDLHTDETLDPAATSLSVMADETERHGWGGCVTASHCVSLSMQPEEHQAAVAARLAEVGVAVVALPATNLWLQGRHDPVGTPRGVTAVRRLLDAGVVVGSGADNLRDPFCPAGRADPFETATLLALTAHLSPAEAWWAVTGGARQAMGVGGGALDVGAPADVLAARGRDLEDAIARASAERTVLRRGTVVARTSVTRSIAR
ncbi:amidohydrolase family protein [Dermatobacter hominis]|uniref:amidohydrolase family protein n=1 Tax=Dermatobacter hominis TaxID=2884263 RepID=UPI001D1240BA|nr:amidohydrolase family protein [Dermatobacter hominis]UDY36049.1 amidohydrolase family protein [Dermatobacter hominis]